ncbi:DUF3558 domain-containing protein [Actinoalloteichus fjordicus]|nr:DUF3558 domain-containing protein [Actinoalloteichus fjordicus]
MNITSLRRLSLVGLYFLILSACSVESGGSASPAVTSAADETGATEPDVSGQSADPSVPVVRDPKDATGLDVCELVSPAAAATAGFDPSGRRDEAEGYEACRWAPLDDSLAGVSVNVRDDRGGLSLFYDQEELFSDFTEFSVGGNPGVQATIGGSDDSSICDVHVGLSDSQYISFRSSRGPDQPDDLDSCDQAFRLAEAVVPELPDA